MNKTQQISLFLIAFALITHSVSGSEQQVSKYWQEYSLAAQRPDGAIAFRKQLRAKYPAGLPIMYQRLIPSIEMNVHLYSNYTLDSAQQEVSEITTLQHVLQQQFDVLDKEAHGLSTDFYFVSGKEMPLLHRYIGELAKKNGIEKPLIAIADNKGVVNAFAASNDSKRGFVVVTTGFLSECSDAAIETILAHEIGHIVNGDTIVRRRVEVFFGPKAPVLPTTFAVLSLLIDSAMLTSTIAKAAFTAGPVVLRFSKLGFIAFILPKVAYLMSLAATTFYNKFYLTQQENRADDFAKEQGCNAADGILTFETAVSEKKQEIFRVYNELLEEYYEHYVADKDHNKKAAVSIRLTIENIKRQQEIMLKHRGFYLPLEQRVARLK